MDVRDAIFIAMATWLVIGCIVGVLGIREDIRRWKNDED